MAALLGCCDAEMVDPTGWTRHGTAMHVDSADAAQLRAQAPLRSLCVREARLTIHLHSTVHSRTLSTVHSRTLVLLAIAAWKSWLLHSQLRTLLRGR